MSQVLRSIGARLRLMLAFGAVVCLTGCGSPPPVAPTPTLAIVCPANESVRATLGNANATVTYSAPSATGGKAPLTTSCSPLSGASFPVGTTPVSCTTTDSGGHEAQCSFSVAVDPAPVPRLSLTKFMAYGDSFTEGKTSATKCTGGMVFPTSYTLKLTAMLLSRYSAQTIVVVNEGCGGEPAVDAVGTGRFDERLAADNPQVLLLIDGANDIIGGNPAVIPAVVGAMDTMGSHATARGAQVFIATLPPSDPTKRSGTGAPLVGPLNSGIATLASKRGWTLVDVNAAFKGDLGLLGSDGLHPTDAGHQVIAQTFYDQIVKTLELPPAVR